MGRTRCRALIFLALAPVFTGRQVSAAPPTCAAGRYLVRGQALLTGTRRAAVAARVPVNEATVILLSNDTVSIAGICPPTPVRLVGRRKRTRVRAVWQRCDALSGPVKLRGVIGGKNCRSLTGTLGITRAKRRRRFRATFSLADSRSCEGSTFEQIEHRILGPRGCRVETCHGGATSGGLDLRPGVAHAALVGAPATMPAAAAAGKLRVVPGDPEASFLWHKLSGQLGADEGMRMPQIGRPLDQRELEVVRAWIEAGAPATGRVTTAPCLPPEPFSPAPALAPPPGGYQIVFEGPTLQPGEEREGCTWIRVPNTEDFVVGSWEYSLNPGSHHFALWERVTDDLPELGPFSSTPCRGGTRIEGVTLSSAPQSPYFVDAYPPGVGRIVKGGSLLGIDPHYHNEFDVPVQMKAWINMHPVIGEVRHLAESLNASPAELAGRTPYSIFVPPFSTAALRLRIGPQDEPWSIVQLSSHQHQRGTRFTAWRSDGSRIFENLDWSHPAILNLDPPLVLDLGDYLEFECEQDNGVTRQPRRCGDSPFDLGCTRGEPIPLRSGPTSADEMCLLTGLFYRR